jgi:hypothetical protein
MEKTKTKRLSRAAQLADLQSVVAPSDAIKAQIKYLIKEKRLLGDKVCTMAWFDDVWYFNAEYIPNTPCNCGNCQGIRLWPSIYVSKRYGLSWECSQDMSRRQRNDFVKQWRKDHAR